MDPGAIDGAWNAHCILADVLHRNQPIIILVVSAKQKMANLETHHVRSIRNLKLLVGIHATVGPVDDQL